MKNRLLVIGILLGVCLGVGALVWASAREVTQQRADRVAVILAGGAE